MFLVTVALFRFALIGTGTGTENILFMVYSVVDTNRVVFETTVFAVSQISDLDPGFEFGFGQHNSRELRWVFLYINRKLS